VAGEIARRFGGRVHLFRAVQVPPEFPAAAKTSGDKLPKLLEVQASSHLIALAEECEGVVIEPPDMSTPQPWRAILNAADRVDADLIVIGSHGYGGWDRFLGTTASKVVDHASRSVFVVHDRDANEGALSEAGSG